MQTLVYGFLLLSGLHFESIRAQTVSKLYRSSDGTILSACFCEVNSSPNSNGPSYGSSPANNAIVVSSGSQVNSGGSGIVAGDLVQPISGQAANPVIGNGITANIGIIVNVNVDLVTTVVNGVLTTLTVTSTTTQTASGSGGAAAAGQTGLSSLSLTTNSGGAAVSAIQTGRYINSTSSATQSPTGGAIVSPVMTSTTATSEATTSSSSVSPSQSSSSSSSLSTSLSTLTSSTSSSSSSSSSSQSSTSSTACSPTDLCLANVRLNPGLCGTFQPVAVQTFTSSSTIVSAGVAISTSIVTITETNVIDVDDSTDTTTTTTTYFTTDTTTTTSTTATETTTTTTTTISTAPPEPPSKRQVVLAPACANLLQVSSACSCLGLTMTVTSASTTVQPVTVTSISTSEFDTTSTSMTTTIATTSTVTNIATETEAYLLTDITTSTFVARETVTSTSTSIIPCPTANAGRELIVNGGFEDGLTSWTVANQNSGNWFSYASTNLRAPSSNLALNAPPQGNKAAVTDTNGPGSHVLYQDVTLPGCSSILLSWSQSFSTSSGTFTAPNSFSTSVVNQQFRVDVIDPVAQPDPFTLVVLAKVYQTLPGNPTKTPFATVTYDLTRFAGQTIRLRYGEVDNQGVFNAAVDAVSITY